jgi:CheY-like chemotaxis protein
LDFSKIDSQKLQIINNPFSFTSLIHDTISIIRIKADAHGLSVTTCISDDIPAVINGDELRLKQVLINLLDNAIKFTPRGSVHLSASSEEAADGLVRLNFSVKDTGIGIMREDMVKLFEGFQQLDTHKNRNVMGTGLGLSITRSLIELMNGAVSVESEYGIGSTFSFYVICKKVESHNAKEHASTDSTNKVNEPKLGAFMAEGASVLLVDDNRVNLMVAEGLLQKYGVETASATDGQKAIEMVKEKDYDIVFMDYMMPGMDGLETTKAIRALGGRFCSMPIVALSADAISGTEELFFEAGMNDFLSKPILIDELNEMLLNYLPEDKIKK